LAGTGPTRRPAATTRPAALVLAGVLCVAAAASGQSIRTDLVTRAGLVNLNVTNMGYLGNGFSNPSLPSCEYPPNSNVEHIYLAGIWVGAVMASGQVAVTTGAQDASSLEAGEQFREFAMPTDSTSVRYPVREWSNVQNSDFYHPDALATHHLEVSFNDFQVNEAGTHTPLGIKVVLRALSWGAPYADDFVILDYRIINLTDDDLTDVYLGFWNDTTVGNTTLTDPYPGSQGTPWNFYDDMNGALRPGDVEGDDLWMMYEHDEDGWEGLAASWVGTRLLGTSAPPQPAEGMPPVSYNQWRFQGQPDEDDWYLPAGEQEDRPGKYQILANGDWDVDQPGEDPVNSLASNWTAMLSTGPFPLLAGGDTLSFTVAIVCGQDSLSLLENSKVAQLAYDQGFTIPAGPPSPRLTFEYARDSVTLAWEPGDSVGGDAEGNPVELASDDPRRSPEHHISLVTNQPDFQGYRIYRFQGDTFQGDPYEEAVLVAQYDKIDGIGFDTGLPPLGADGRRRFTDTGLLDGFPYYYSVVSYSAPNLEEGLPEFQSGYNENATLVFPGPGAAPAASGPGVGVFPNPYRAGSYFDDRLGEQELGRKIWFTNLPARCTIKVFSLAGDLVATLDHDDPASGMEPWDLLSSPQRAIATGLYVYVVEDRDTGDVQRGKLVIIK